LQVAVRIKAIEIRRQLVLCQEIKAKGERDLWTRQVARCQSLHV
jgi:hypothetical protein